MNFAQFAATHRIVTAEQFAADDNRPVDLEFYPNATLHAFDFKWPCGDHCTYYVIKVADGFHYTFQHPHDEVTRTLNFAARHLFDAITG